MLLGRKLGETADDVDDIASASVSKTMVSNSVKSFEFANASNQMCDMLASVRLMQPDSYQTFTCGRGDA